MKLESPVDDWDSINEYIVVVSFIRVLVVAVDKLSILIPVARAGYMPQLHHTPANQIFAGIYSGIAKGA